MGKWHRSSVFPGSAEECDLLLAAVRSGCTCAPEREGPTVICGSHALLLDERTVKYLIFYRRYRATLWASEGSAAE